MARRDDQLSNEGVGWMRSAVEVIAVPTAGTGGMSPAWGMRDRRIAVHIATSASLARRMGLAPSSPVQQGRSIVFQYRPIQQRSRQFRLAVHLAPDPL
jgi:hypothetical protein